MIVKTQLDDAAQAIGDILTKLKPGASKKLNFLRMLPSMARHRYVVLMLGLYFALYFVYEVL